MTKIHEFDPVIYPFRLWVAIKPDMQDISDKFYGLTHDMERVSFGEVEKDQFTVASTFVVSSKESGWIGNLIIVDKPKMLNVKFICHEASHAVDFVCEQIGMSMISFENGEARAYLIGWIADCIYKVKTGKE